MCFTGQNKVWDKWLKPTKVSPLVFSKLSGRSLAHSAAYELVQIKLPKHAHTLCVTITSSHHRMKNASSSEVTNCNQRQSCPPSNNHHRWAFLPIRSQTDSKTRHPRWTELASAEVRRETYTTRKLYRYLVLDEITLPLFKSQKNYC